jgi:outer membrane beta-barrel protein
METRLRILLLIPLAGLAGCAAMRGAPAPTEPMAGPAEPAAVISPQVQRREVSVADIDTENWEVGAFIGSISVQDFGVNFVYGGRLAYHITEDFFAELSIGTADAGVSSYERVTGIKLLTKGQREFSYYDLSFGWNVLPGEVFFGGNRAYNTALYLIGGVGSTSFAGDERFTVNVGAGARILLQDGLALRLDVRDRILAVDVFGEDKRTHNFEAALSVTGFF